MKKIALIVLTLTLFSCGSSKTVRTSNNVIKGDWTLNSITYNKSGTFNVTLLDDENKSCFENSTWKFIPNNNTGIYTINNTSCNNGDRHFIFTIDEVDKVTGLYDFLLKPTNKKRKSITNQGFRLNLSALSDTTMQWKQTVSVEGSPFIITMNFSKL